MVAKVTPAPIRNPSPDFSMWWSDFTLRRLSQLSTLSRPSLIGTMMSVPPLITRAPLARASSASSTLVGEVVVPMQETVWQMSRWS